MVKQNITFLIKNIQNLAKRIVDGRVINFNDLLEIGEYI